ncbi:hypothetical protein L596_017229 [Steinernema carpocapsae]|uniref:Transcription initiation factor TFIID subunit 1 histone acetyltransferase domain-containing protein n=1 Tax=Steinernema carpocapsae TaxID=34508 RepID=A0A4U5N1A4_STECR|nr:hypothetical protein L596_017229 [Steinernema carpocapsae]
MDDGIHMVEQSEFVPPSLRDDAPLACIVPPEIEDIDPRRFFPEFDRKKVLRMTRLFEHSIKESSKTQIWWTCETFYKRMPNEGGKEDVEKREFKLQIAPKPPLSECQPDGRVLLLKPILPKAKGPTGSDDEEDIEPWRNGPAKMWYDKIGLPSTTKACDYGLMVRKQAEAKNSKKLRYLNSDSAKDATKPNVDSDDSEGEPEKEDGTWTNVKPAEIGDDVFLPVNLTRWEDDVIFSDTEARDMVVRNMEKFKNPFCGWIPTQNTRSYESFVAAVKNKTFEQMFTGTSSVPTTSASEAENNEALNPCSDMSIFPPDNMDLFKTRWEDDIIFDSNDVGKLPPPRILTLDYTDDPNIFGVPVDKPNEDRMTSDSQDSTPKTSDHMEHQFTRKSKMILGQVQQRQKQGEEEQLESNIVQMTDKGPFNISNDEYYMPKATKILGSTLIQHSIPAQNLHRAFFPTHLTSYRLRHWHRLAMMKKQLRMVGMGRYVHVQPLEKHIREMELFREKQKAKEGGGEIFFMREVSDLSGKNGTLLLLEYSEEHPPLLSQPGMASRIRNYHKRKPGNDVKVEYEFGEKAFVHNTPFLGNLGPGQSIQSLENMLFRAPIYRHTPIKTDFLLIRSKNGWFIRNCPQIFLVGQECPLVEVPSPNSKKASVFVRDFLLAFIYRLFWNSDSKPRRLLMEDIKVAFPHYAESSVRKRLKQCSDFKRLGTGPDRNYWVLREDFRLPSKEEVMAMVTPEHCCSQYSMMAAEQRLRDAGYGERYAFAPENEDDSDDQVTIEDEIKCAPWNTTRCFIQASKGRCLLDQTGIADPTGCGQGFSYVRVSNKPQKVKIDVPQMPKRLVTGTNADLRKLPLKEAKEICREYGVREEEINSLSRWEIIDVIRTLSTQAAKSRSDGTDELSGMARFARKTIRYNYADMQEKYKKHCQEVFENQNQNLANPEILTTDEGSSGEDSDNEELARNLENMLKASKGKGGLTFADRQKMEFEDEEKERRELQKMLQNDVLTRRHSMTRLKIRRKLRFKSPRASDQIDPNSSSQSVSNGPKKLKIYRTYRNEDSSEAIRIEVINKTTLIDAYLKIRNERDSDFIRTYAQMDEQYKEEKRKEKRRLQDQLRRIRRNQAQAKEPQAAPTKCQAALTKCQAAPTKCQAAPKKRQAPPKLPKPINPNLAKMRCSACHGIGHMKTNKNCPLYGQSLKEGSMKTIGKMLLQEEKEAEEKTPLRLPIPQLILEEQHAKAQPLMADAEMTANSSDVMDDDEDQESDMNLLHDDLAMSGDEDDSDLEDYDGSSDLLHSQMHMSDQLVNDLALTDSDDSEDSEATAAKQPKMDDFAEEL